jgi:hypothetical protein
MMGWGPWAGPMWFWWIFPVVGLAVCLLFIMPLIRALGGRWFVCGDRYEPGPDETAELRREVRELREELNRLKAVR